jgi:hypothetical protein
MAVKPAVLSFVFRLAVDPAPTLRSEALTPGMDVSTTASRRIFSGRAAARSRFARAWPERRPMRSPAPLLGVPVPADSAFPAARRDDFFFPEDARGVAPWTDRARIDLDADGPGLGRFFARFVAMV